MLLTVRKFARPLKVGDGFFTVAHDFEAQLAGRQVLSRQFEEMDIIGIVLCDQYSFRKRAQATKHTNVFYVRGKSANERMGCSARQRIEGNCRQTFCADQSAREADAIAKASGVESEEQEVRESVGRKRWSRFIRI